MFSLKNKKNISIFQLKKSILSGAMPIAGVRFGENHLSASAFSFTRGIYLWSHSQTYLSDINIDDILDNFFFRKFGLVFHFDEMKCRTLFSRKKCHLY